MIAAGNRINRMTGERTGTLLIASLLVFARVQQVQQVQAQRPEAERPNILFILADDVGSDVLGCYGGESYATPRLDELAATGLRFLHNYSMPVCHPTRITALTGRYPFRWSHPRWGTFPPQAEARTVARHLQRAGYATAIAGKWQLAMLRDEPDHPHRLGFDEYCVFGWHEGPRYYQPMIYQNGKVRQDVRHRYGPDVYTQFLLDFMTRNRSGPFFAFYSMALCHDVTDDLEEPVPHGPADRYDTYAEMVAAMDLRVGRLIDALEHLALRESTVVVYTTDNGTPKRYIHAAREGQLIRKPVVSRRNGEEVPGGKGELTDAGTRVPLIVNWPGTVARGETVEDLVDCSDFFATFAELAQEPIAEEAQLDSISFAPRLRERRPGARRWAFAEHRGQRWVRSRDWKLYADGRLYHLDQDAHEREALNPPLSGDAEAALTFLRSALPQ